MSYVFLALAIICEVVGTMLLPSSQNFTKLLPSVVLVIAYMLSFYFLTFALRDIPIAVVYACWAGLGVFLVALLGYFFFNQSLQWQAIAGLCLIVSGVALVNTYSSNH